jgi:hypothetical protein
VGVIGKRSWIVVQDVALIQASRIDELIIRVWMKSDWTLNDMQFAFAISYILGKIRASHSSV